MMKNKKNKLKTYTLEKLTDKHIGKYGTPKRDAFEKKLFLDILSEVKEKKDN